METLQVLLEISLVIFMAGNLLDMGLRLKMSEALRGLRNVRFVAASLLWGDRYDCSKVSAQVRYHCRFCRRT